ncbi:probable WRKY transcription factor 32 isoform X2 [Cajanus cajan]|uniref:probable WRKY transcription factor 32 isoform X2 n=1 Tax=Cajanus cajan TaxID=3821 RepID=UPI00098D7697|nr:probable WRKY transcription factor 32 isoform X2 [Cajanus cajan]
MEEEEPTQQRVTHSSLATESLTSTRSETLALCSSLPRDHSAPTHMKQQQQRSYAKVGETENKSAWPPVEETIVKRAVEAPKKQTENKLKVSVCSTSLSELSPTSVSQSLSSAPCTTIPEQRLSSPKANSVQVPEVDERTPCGGTTLSSVSVARESASESDGYNWRKYGQKQVKSPMGSRSYYRCTHSNCSAKKIKFCDHSGNVIEIVHKSQHSHDPPHKIDFAKESKFLPSSEPKVESSVPKQSVRVLNDSNPSSSPKEPPSSADKNLENSSNGENGNVILKEEHVNVTKPKRRLDKGDLACMDSAVKPGKKPKFVAHVADDEGISGDGYRWRKYGQKLVKGNPYIRNYYRCTFSGCPVRKHVETAVDNSKAPMVTYKGLHDHDKPVPKKRHGPSSASHVAAAVPASTNNLESRKTGLLQNQETSECSEETEGELTGEALDLGGEKAIESARALLSIGYEIKPF